MKEGSVQEKAFSIIEPIANSLGYVLVEIAYKKENTGMALNVCIDKDGGVDINDCEKLSRALDQPLDDNDITNGASYVLNVSSYGLDRALKTDYDFNKHIGLELIIKFYKPFDGKKEIRATLTSFDKDNVVVEYNNNSVTISRKDLALVQRYIEF